MGDGNTKRDETVCGVPLGEVAKLMCPWNTGRLDPIRLEKLGLLSWDSQNEEWQQTQAGKDKVEEIRAAHGMTFVQDGGGGRWDVQRHALHCGEGLEVLLASGVWLPVRFEVAFIDGVRSPVFYVGTASGAALKCSAQYGLDKELFRLPAERRR